MAKTERLLIYLPWKKIMNINNRLYMMTDEIQSGDYNYEDVVSILDTCTSIMNHSQLNDLLNEHGFTEELYRDHLSPI